MGSSEQDMLHETHSPPVLTFKANHAITSVPDAWHNLLMGLALFLLAGIGCARIVSTYHVFNQTTDEPAHLATGMEWLERGTYTLEPLHPPLARVAVAIGPYLSGLRLTGHDNLWMEGNQLLLAQGRYLHNLSLARLGVLPFFLLATFLVWYWTRWRYGDGSRTGGNFSFYDLSGCPGPCGPGNHRHGPDCDLYARASGLHQLPREINLPSSCHASVSQPRLRSSQNSAPWFSCQRADSPCCLRNGS